MRTICIYNHKGGVGKTTTSINLAAGLSRQGKRVLLVDLDPQGNIDVSLRLKAEFDIYEAMTGKIPIQRCIVNVATNFDVVTSRETLTKAEYYLSSQSNSKLVLKDLLGSIMGYDYMLIDCPPSLGILNQNVLAFCREAFVTVSTDFLGYDALRKMQEIMNKINQTYGNNIRVTKVIPTLYDRRNRICIDTLKEIKMMFPSITSTPIRYNSKLKEAPKFGQSIFKYAKSSIGAKDYEQLVNEVLAMEKIAVHASAD
ncbi:MAG TPA: ParA family protein [Candidatus Nanoarchaeia archaeon]|nr:ParA family protein [Candidatus Nanoarchaeia archaeon]